MKGDKGTEALVKAGGAAVVAGAAAGTGAAALAAAGIMAEEIFFGAAEAVRNYRRKRMANWWLRIATELGESSETVQELVREKIDEPYINETIWQSVRGVMESLDDAVTPALAALAAAYLQSSKRPDRFFRGLVRTLSDLSAEEFRDLRSFVEQLAAIDGVGAASVIARSRGPGKVEAYAHPPPATPTPPNTVLVGITHAKRLMHLLKVHELANEPPDLLMGGDGASMQMDGFILTGVKKFASPKTD